MTYELYGYDKQTGVEIIKIETDDSITYEKGNHKLHRDDGPAFEDSKGNKCWYRNDKLHRMDEPAVERADGRKEWHVLGHLHRFDGPAIECPNGYKKWYWEGIEMENEAEFLEWKKGHEEGFKKTVASHLVIPKNVKPRCMTLTEEELTIIRKALNGGTETFTITKKPKV